MILQKHIRTVTIISKPKPLHLPLPASQPEAADKTGFFTGAVSFRAHGFAQR